MNEMASLCLSMVIVLQREVGGREVEREEGGRKGGGERKEERREGGRRERGRRKGGKEGGRDNCGISSLLDGEQLSTCGRIHSPISALLSFLSPSLSRYVPNCSFSLFTQSGSFPGVTPSRSCWGQRSSGGKNRLQ